MADSDSARGGGGGRGKEEEEGRGDDELLFEVIEESGDEGAEGCHASEEEREASPPPPTSFDARFLDHLWFEDVDAALEKHAYHERKKVLLCKANYALLRQKYQEALQLCEEARPLISQKGETREWAETEARAALALHKLDRALPAARKRAELDRGYEWSGRRLFADTAFAAGHIEDALSACQLCLVAQKTNFRSWALLSQCYIKLSSGSDNQRLRNYAEQALIRGLAWLKFTHNNSNGFVKQRLVKDEDALAAELQSLRPDLAGLKCQDAMERVQGELEAQGVGIADAPGDLGRDYLEIVPPKGLTTDREAFEAEWFCTRRRLPDERNRDDAVPEPELPEKGPRTGN